MSSTATKVLAGLVLFASGAVMGFFGARYLAERGRLALLHGDPRHFAEMVLRHMADDLDLSQAQQEKLRPIMLNTADAIDKIRREQEPKVHEVIEKTNADIKKLLTPAQQEKFVALLQRLERRRKAMERFGPPPPPPGMGGFPPPPPGGHPPPGMEGFPPPPGGPGGPPPPGLEGLFPPPPGPPPHMSGTQAPREDAAPAPAKPETQAPAAGQQ